MALLVLLVTSTVLAKTHRIYEYDRSRGLATTSVHGIGQDRDGFLWVGGARSLFRFDGKDFVRWHEGLLDGDPSEFTEDQVEGMLVRMVHAKVTVGRITKTGLEPYEPPVEPPLDLVRDLAADKTGGLWITDRVGLRHRDAEGVWTTMDAELFDGQRPLYVHANEEGDAIVASSTRLFRVDTTFEPDLLATTPDRIFDVYQSERDEVFLIHGGGVGGYLKRLDGDELTYLASAPGRPTAVISRGDAVWMAMDYSLVRWHPRDGVERMKSNGSAYSGGGRFFVDHEGSLWIASFANLIQLPESATTIWTLQDDLGAINMTNLTYGGEGLWAAAYGSLSLISESDGQLRGEVRDKGFSPYPICVDADGRAWHGRKVRYDRPSQLFESIDGSSRVHELAGDGMDGQCATARAGHVWFARGGELFATPRGGGAPSVVGRLPSDDRVFAFYESKDERLWIARWDSVCHAASSPPPTQSDWECEEDRFHYATTFVEPAPGELWINTGYGVLRRTEQEWEFIDGIDRTTISKLKLSPRGGVWIVGRDFVHRVLPEENDPGRVRTVETMTLWQGIPDEGATSFIELESGEIWMGTLRGTVHIPAEVRDQELPVPAVRLTDLRIGGEPIPLTTKELSLPHDQNDVELSYAAMSYRNRGLVRYRVRSDPNDPWRETLSSSISFADLRPGEYRPEIAASLDGVRWTEEPANFRIVIAAPWYQTIIARVAFVLIALSILYAIYRVRLAVQLQAERQRTRIAMDLHDEMGSGLGSIRILSDVLDQDELPEEGRREVLGQIQHAAEELSVALADIVWSLRPRARKLTAVLSRIETLARRLLPAPTVDVVIEANDVDVEMILSQPVCKNVLSIAAEALHNAARHGKPSNVTVSLAKEKSRLRMTIEDDGVGFDAPRVRAEGLGLSSMTRRATDIDATVEIDSAPGSGTRVVLSFDPRARDRRESGESA